MQSIWSGPALYLGRKVTDNATINVIRHLEDVATFSQIKQLDFINLVSLSSIPKNYLKVELGLFKIYLGSIQAFGNLPNFALFQELLLSLVQPDTPALGLYSIVSSTPNSLGLSTSHPLIIFPSKYANKNSKSNGKNELLAFYLRSPDSLASELSLFSKFKLGSTVPTTPSLETLLDSELASIELLENISVLCTTFEEPKAFIPHPNQNQNQKHTPKQTSLQRNPKSSSVNKQTLSKNLSKHEIEEKNKKVLQQLIIIELKMKKILRDHPEFDELWGQIYKSSKFTIRKKINSKILSLDDLQAVVAKNTDFYCS